MSEPGKPLRWIGHADLDAFYASVEQRDHPEYRNRPVVVGALPGQRGVVAAANYLARTFGIHSAMPIGEAYLRCPDALYLRPDFARYKQVSQEIFRILGTITPVVEPVSVDEAYLDLSGLERLIGPPDAIGNEIKHRILEMTGLTVSVGIGPNRLIAKLGSEHHKPDGLTVVWPDQVQRFLAPLPVAKLRGLGRQTQRVFARLGIVSVAQLRALPLGYLEKQLGKRAALNFHQQAFGIASAVVRPGRTRKSISKEVTFQQDIQEDSRVYPILHKLAAEVAAKARKEQLSGVVVMLKIRCNDFETYTRQHRLPVATHDERVILGAARALFNQRRIPNKPIRLIGVGISDWQEPESPQADLFGQSQRRKIDDRLLATIDQATDRFGEGALQLGCALKQRSEPRER
ncbi:MAG: DNA polymerase IV [Gammaproteobacteria bacterium]|nr:DNA polymerase IV [Gammaproteobacteria bacterium]MCP5416991.1 DNA polymerase IV [Chromatiaceae bacterium]